MTAQFTLKTGKNLHGRYFPPLNYLYLTLDSIFRRTAYFTTALVTTVAEWISAKLTSEFIGPRSASDTAYLWCLIGGLASFVVGISFLWLLPTIPEPSTDKPVTDSRSPASILPQPDMSSSLVTGPGDSRSSVKTHTSFIAILFAISGVARSPLASSVFSSFAVRYISRRLNFDTSDAVVLTKLTNIVPPLFVVAWWLIPRLISHRPGNSRSTAPQLPTTFSEISGALILLTIAGIGTGMMTISSSFMITRSYPFVLTAILLICIGSWYPLFIEPILAGFSAEGKKPWVFVPQQVANAIFASLGAWLLNWGFQRETDDGQRPHGHIGWTYLGIMGVCVAAGCSLVAAVLLSSDKTSGGVEGEETERDNAGQIRDG